MIHFAHWFFTIGTAWSFVNMIKTVNRPLATRSIVVGRKRFRKTHLDNIMDAAGAIYGLAFFAAIAGVLWLS